MYCFLTSDSIGKSLPRWCSLRMTVISTSTSPFILSAVPETFAPPTPIPTPPKPLYSSKKIKVIAIRQLQPTEPAAAVAASVKVASATHSLQSNPLKRHLPSEPPPPPPPTPASNEEALTQRPMKRIRVAELPSFLEWTDLNDDEETCLDCKGRLVTLEREGRVVCTVCGLVSRSCIISDQPERMFGKDGSGERGAADGNARSAFNPFGTEALSYLATYLEQPQKGANDALHKTQSSVLRARKPKPLVLHDHAEHALRFMSVPGGERVSDALRKKALLHFDHYLSLSPRLVNQSTIRAVLVVTLKLASEDFKEGFTLRSLYEANEEVKWGDVCKKLKAIEALRAGESRAAAEQKKCPLDVVSAPKLISRPPSTLAASVDGFMSRLGVHIKVITFCRFVADRMSDLSLLIGKRPDSQLAAVLMFAMATLPEAKGACPVRQISDTAGVSATTMYTHFCELYEHKHLLLPVRLAVSAAAPASEAARIELHNLRCEEYNGPLIDSAVVASLPTKVPRKHFLYSTTLNV